LDGRFPEGTVGELIERRLRAFAECVKGFQAVGAAEATLSRAAKLWDRTPPPGHIVP
jgi:hypothetical protein